MKKYSKKHLESVPPEFIVALEKTLEMVKNKNCFASSCPDLILYYEFNCETSCQADLCPKYIIYDCEYISPCPCWEFGEGKSVNMMENLITQWKLWAQVTD